MSRLLVIDDEELIRELMVEILDDAEHEVLGAATFEDALSLLERRQFDLVVSDIVMPGCSGLDLLEAIHERRPSLPVVLVTGAGTYENLSKALARGAAGLVTKPFSHAELRRAVADAIERAERSERELRERLLTPTLASALANAIEARDPYLHGHCERLAGLAVRLALRLRLPASDIEAVRLGAILHDIGKIGIPDRILLKPGPLEEAEVAEIRRHPLIGDELLEPLDLLGTSRPIVRHHHERWDGGGYPDGLAAEQIPLGARIVSVADAIEVMSTRSVYRTPLSAEQIVAELKAGSGTQWDPQIVALTLELLDSAEIVLASGGVEVAALEHARPRTQLVSVLLVEDDADHARLARAAIEDAVAGARVAHARDIETAAGLCRESSWSLAVVDHQLPDGTGLELLDLLRESAPDLPIVIMTGHGAENVAVEAFRRGVSDYVVKGADHLADLARCVRDLAGAA